MVSLKPLVKSNYIKLHRIRCIAGALALAVAWFPQVSWAQPATLTVQLNSIFIARQGERSGDEPYLMTIGFRGRTDGTRCTSGPEVRRVSIRQDNIRDRDDWARTGTTHTIGTRFGTFSLDVPSQDGWFFGMAVVVMEEDGTPSRSVSGGLAERATEEVRRRVNESLCRLGAPSRSRSAWLVQALRDFTDALLAAGIWVLSGFDPDDRIGVGGVVIATLGDAPPVYVIGATDVEGPRAVAGPITRPFDHGFNLVFDAGGDGRYVINGRAIAR